MIKKILNFLFKPEPKNVTIFLYVNRKNKLSGYGIKHVKTALRCRKKGYCGQVFKRKVSQSFVGYLSQNYEFLN